MYLHKSDEHVECVPLDVPRAAHEQRAHEEGQLPGGGAVKVRRIRELGAGEMGRNAAKRFDLCMICTMYVDIIKMMCVIQMWMMIRIAWGRALTCVGSTQRPEFP